MPRVSTPPKVFNKSEQLLIMAYINFKYAQKDSADYGTIEYYIDQLIAEPVEEGEWTEENIKYASFDWMNINY